MVLGSSQNEVAEQQMGSSTETRKEGAIHIIHSLKKKTEEKKWRKNLFFSLCVSCSSMNEQKKKNQIDVEYF